MSEPSPKIQQVIDELRQRSEAKDIVGLVVVFRTQKGEVCDRTAGEAAEPMTLLLLQQMANEGRNFYFDRRRKKDTSRRPALSTVEESED